MILKMILKNPYVRIEMSRTEWRDCWNCIAFVMHLCWITLTSAHRPSTTTLTVLRIPLVFLMILKMILKFSYVRIEFPNNRCPAESCIACFMHLRWITLVATHEHAHTQTHANSAYLRVYTYIHIYIYMDIYIYMYVCMYVCNTFSLICWSYTRTHTHDHSAQ